MITSEIVNAVQRQFGDESGAQITQSDIIRWINSGQRDINRKIHVLQDHRETSITAELNSYDLPSNYLSMVRVTFDNRKLDLIRLEDLDLRTTEIDSSPSGTPISYYLWDRKLYLYPPPNASGSSNLDIWYARLPVDVETLADTPDLPEEMHEDLIRYCMIQARELDSDLEGKQQAQSDYSESLEQAKHETTESPLDSYPAVRCLPGDMG